MRKKRSGKSFFLFLIGGIAVIVLAWALYSYFFVPSSPVSESPDENVEYIPAPQGELVRHTYYILGYEPTHKQAAWVYYIPRIAEEGSKTERTNNFREDPLVPSGSASPADYTKSGYDRGHLCPAGDMTLSEDAMSETFYMSNMSPQQPAFNRGIWKSLEEQVRKWGIREQIYVVTGPVFTDNKGTIGKNRVTVPGYYYKVVYSPSRRQMIGFILPNEKVRKKLTDYVVSVDSVENVTGLDFFPQLPDSLENRLEERSVYARWQ